MRSVVLSAFAAVLALPGCAAQEKSGSANLPAGAEVTFTFHDSSVPPPYHRSYTLTVTEETSRIVVDSYGDLLADETVATSPDAWQALGEGYGQLAILSPSPRAQGCAGGTSFDLDVTLADETLTQIRVDMCGGANAEVDELISAWIAPAREQFPLMSDLAPEGQ